MRIKKIQTENFRNFIHQEIELSDKPILVIYDENGIGKTSIHESILFGLGGEIYRYNNSNYKAEFGTIDALYSLRARKNSRITVELFLENENDEILSLKVNRPKRKRTYLTPSELNNGIDIQFQVNNQVLKEKDFLTFFENQFYTHPMIIQTTNFLSQELINEALVTDKATRGEVFSKLLSFDWMQDLHNTIQDEIITLRENQRNYKRLIANETLKLAESEISKLYQQVRQQGIEFVTGEMKLKSKDKVEIIDVIDRFYKIYAITGEAEKKEDFEEIINKKDFSKISTKNVQKWFKDLDLHLQNVQTNIGELSNQSKKENTSISFFEKSIDQYSTLNKTRNEINTSLVLANKEVADGKKELIDVENELKTSKNQIKVLQDLMKQIELILDESEIPNDFNLQSLENEIKKMKGDLKSTKKVAAKIQDFSNDFKVKYQKDIEYRKKQVQFEEEIIPMQEYSISQLIRLFNEFLKLVPENQDKEKLGVQIQKIEAIEEDSVEKSKELQKLKGMLNGILKEQELENLKEKKERLKENREFISSSPEESTKSLEELVSQLENKIENMNNELKSMEASNQKIMQDQEIIKNQSNKSLITFGINIGIIILGLVLVFTTPIGMLGFLIVFIGLFTTFTTQIFLPSPKLIELPILSQLIAPKLKLQVLEKQKGVFGSRILSLKNQQSELMLEKSRTITEINQNKKLLMKEFEYSTIEAIDDELRKLENQDLQLSLITKIIEYSNNLIDKIKLKSDNQKLEVERAENLALVTSTLVNIFPKENISHMEFEKLKEFFEIQSLNIADNTNNLEEINSKTEALILNFKEAFDEKTQQNPFNSIFINLSNHIEKSKSKLEELKIQIAANEKLWTDQDSKIKEITSKITTLETDLKTKLEILGLDESIIKLEKKEFINKVTSKINSVSKTLETRKKDIEKCYTLREELLALQQYFANLELLQKQWNKKQKEMRESEEKINIWNKKVSNAENLEGAWEEVNKEIKKRIDDVSINLISNLRKEFKNNFELLGGHDDLPYYELDIKYLRNKIQVSIDVGDNKNNSGSPKALFSNGQQVSLILALYFSMAKHILQSNPLKYIGLDEPTQYFDSFRKASFVEFLEFFYDDLKDETMQLIITTADKEFIQIIEEKQIEFIDIKNLASLIDDEFEDLKPSLDVGRSIEVSAGTSSEADDDIDLPGLDSDLELPPSVKPTKTKRPDIKIDVLDDGNEYTCSICRSKFYSLIFREMCDKSDCISEYRKTRMF